MRRLSSLFFFFNDTATTEIYTLSLHDALPISHRGFHRAIGSFGEARISPDGRVITEAEWDARRREWLPTPEDAQFVATLMRPAVEPGRFAGWIAPPARGINGLPLDHEYVRLTRKEG